MKNTDTIDKNKIKVDINIRGSHYHFSETSEDFDADFKMTSKHLILEVKRKSGQVFISYSFKNVEFANQVKEKLRYANINVWMDEEKVSAGDHWRHEIEDALQKSDIVLVLLDKHSVQSHYVTYEWAFALGSKKEGMVIPLVIEDCTIHPRIDKDILKHIEFKNGNYWEKLIGIIKSKLNRH